MGGPDLEASIKARLDEPQEILMGRKTYLMLAEMAGSSEGTGAAPTRMDELSKVVLSRSLSGPLPWTPARLVGGELAEVIGALKAEDGPMLCMIGSVTIQRDLLAATCWIASALWCSPSCLAPPTGASRPSPAMSGDPWS